MSRELKIHVCRLQGKPFEDNILAVKKSAAKSKFLQLHNLPDTYYIKVKSRVKDIPIPKGYEDFVIKNNIPFAYPGMVVKTNSIQGWIIGYEQTRSNLIILTDKNDEVLINPNSNIAYYDSYGAIIRKYRNGKLA